jgi:double zinc ribbon protein
MSTGQGWRSREAAIWIAGIAGGVGALVVLLGGARISLPGVFMGLAAVMLVLALAALWQSLRSAFGEHAHADATRANLPERAQLVDEKNSLLRAIKDIAFEREVGKLSEDDFARLDRSYRLRAKEVLRKLDEDLAPFLERAEQLIDAPPGTKKTSPPKAKKKAKKKKRPVDRRICARCGSANASSAEACSECGARIAPVACPSCQAANPPDARFCNKCAAALEPETKSEGEPETKSEGEPETESGGEPE